MWILWTLLILFGLYVTWIAVVTPVIYRRENRRMDDAREAYLAAVADPLFAFEGKSPNNAHQGGPEKTVYRSTRLTSVDIRRHTRIYGEGRFENKLIARWIFCIVPFLIVSVRKRYEEELEKEWKNLLREPATNHPKKVQILLQHAFNELVAAIETCCADAPVGDVLELREVLWKKLGDFLQYRSALLTEASELEDRIELLKQAQQDPAQAEERLCAVQLQLRESYQRMYELVDMLQQHAAQIRLQKLPALSEQPSVDPLQIEGAAEQVKGVAEQVKAAMNEVRF